MSVESQVWDTKGAILQIHGTDPRRLERDTVRHRIDWRLVVWYKSSEISGWQRLSSRLPATGCSLC